MRKRAVLASVLIGIFFPVLVFSASLQLAVFDKTFFTEELEYNRVSLNTGISREALSEVTDEIFDYLKGKRPDFEIRAEMKGQEQVIFNADERIHMEDVLFLYRILWWTGLLALVVSLITAGLLLFWDPRGIGCGILIGALVTLTLILILALAGYFDFTAVFQGAHRLIFANELWLLDPRKSVLINMVPEHYFIHLCVRIALYTAGTLAAAALLSGLLLHRGKRKRERMRNRKF